MTISNFHKVVSYILVFFMLFSPFAFNEVKMACVAILLISVLIGISFYNGKIKISKSILTWLSLFTVHGIFFLFVGLFFGAELSHVLKFATIAVVWPLVFSLLFFYKIDEKYIVNIYRVIEIATVFISLYAIYKVMSLLGFLPAFDIYPQESPGGLMIADGNVEISLPAATTLMFAVPFIVSQYLLTKEKRLIPIIFLSLIAIILISRRALLLNVIITPFICLAISAFFLKKNNLRALINHIFFVYLFAFIACIFIFLVLAQSGIFDIKEFYTMILEGFDFSGKNSVDPGAQIRAEQFVLLMQSWREKPILGWGYGAVSKYIIRSDETPFIYELSYIALLFQTGIIGFISYMSLIGWIYYKFCKIRKHVSLILNKYNVSILVGLTTFLLANATNPYLYAFDHMWTLFFPLLILNTLILKKYEIAN